MLSTLLLLIGLSSSVSLGEVSPGFVGRAIAHGHRWEAQALYDTADKYTGAGWRGQIIGQGVIGSGLLLGAEYLHRNGGAWTKDTGWLRGGYARAWGHNSLQLVLRAAVIGHTENEGAVQVEYRRQEGRVVIATTQGVLWYNQTAWQAGYYMTASVGLTVF